MPFNHTTTKKYARYVLRWALPIGFAVFILNGAYGFLNYEPGSYFSLEYLYYGLSVFAVWFIFCICVGLAVSRLISWVYSDN
jgi:hypothetical protein